MGLGLPICKRLAELHGAQLVISSEPGKGTACKISFPASRCIAAAGESAVAA
jgi:signal transduction histidine kinase